MNSFFAISFSEKPLFLKEAVIFASDLWVMTTGTPGEQSITLTNPRVR
jgi:hypothetical protein